jgi:4-amino-4-deoxy-L-arabinose transferase-like glycosyltransferase
VVLALGLLYWRTAARDIVVGDSPELIATAVVLGVAHPPGYPLFTLVAHLFTLLPIEPLPFRVNLLSVVCHVLAVGLVYLTGWRLTRRRDAAAAAALILGVNQLYWTWSLAAEVFPLNDLLVALLLYLLVVWNERPARSWPLVLAALVFGLGLANHQTIALVAPGIAYLLWRHGAALLRRPVVLGVCAVALVAGLTPYLYLPWAASRQPPLAWGDPTAPGYLLQLVTRSIYGGTQLVSNSAIAGGSPIERLVAFGRSFSVLEWLLLAIGFRYAYRWLRWLFWFTLLAVVLPGPAFAVYANINLAQPWALSVLERFFLLAHVLLAPIVGLGVIQLGELARAALKRARIPELHPSDISAVAPAVSVLIGGVLVVLGVAALPAVNLSDSHVARYYAEDVLFSLDESAVLLVGGDAGLLPIYYLQVAEGRRPDVRLVMRPFVELPWYRRDLARRDPAIGNALERGAPDATLQQAVAEAAQPRQFATVGAPLDRLARGYWYLSRGLTLVVMPPSVDLTVEDLILMNERLIANYRPPPRGAIRGDTMEREILTQYGLVPYGVGNVLEQAQMAARAQEWYRRAIAIDTECWPAYKRLARIALDQGDRGAAIEYLRPVVAGAPNDAEARQLMGRATAGSP